MSGILHGPDVLLLSANWRERALLRAQFLEEGYEVAAIDVWPIPRLYRLPGMKPRVLIIDLRELRRPRETLQEVPSILPVACVLVLTALGTVPTDEIRALGFTVIERPARIGQIVSAAAAMLMSSNC